MEMIQMTVMESFSISMIYKPTTPTESR
uniref:Uncharacterized protein n=1 Tax=Tetranychus urticae TaxID=32264 RepID=T1KX01_TETUR